MTEHKHIIRIANTDLKGEKSVVWALQKIKGVSYSLANASCRIAGIAVNKTAGSLSDKEADRLTEILNSPQAHGVPVWMLNRQKDYETGEDTHLLTGDLKFTTENDIKRLRKIKAYRGTRHGLGLPTRGQRTQSNFRRQKGKGLAGKKAKGGSGN